MSVSQWLQLLISGIVTGAIYALVGLGYVTIYRTSRVVNFAQGSFVMLGALITYSLLNEAGLPFWLSGIVSVVAVVAVAIAMYFLVIAPIIKVSLVSMILVTIGVSFLLEGLALVKWGGYGLGIPSFPGSRTLHFWRLTIEVQNIWVIVIATLLFVGLWVLSNRTRVGKQMTATASDPLSASLAGISTTRMVVLAFAISAAIGAIGGICVGSISPMSYASGGMLGLAGFIAAIVGGWGSSSGAIVGGLTVGIAESLATGFLPGGYRSAVAYVLLIIILYFRPSGILGKGGAAEAGQ
jgi:branched-chain amino acid transport system permease protein